MSVPIFRALIVFSIVAAILLSIIEAFYSSADVGLVTEYAISLNQTAYLDSVSDAWLFGVGLIGLTLLVSITYGMYQFKNWARWLNLYFVLLLIPLAFIEPILVYGPISSLSNDLLMMLEGAIISLCFFSKISDEFEKET